MENKVDRNEMTDIVEQAVAAFTKALIACTVEEKVKESNRVHIEKHDISEIIQEALDEEHRKNNIIVYRLKEQEEMETRDRESILEILKESVDRIEDKDIRACSRIGRREDVKSRPVLVEMSSFKDKLKIINYLRKLSGKTININLAL